MAQHQRAKPASAAETVSKKRKEPPSNAAKTVGGNDRKRPRIDHRSKQRDARNLATQTSSKALKNGELDVEKFVKAREFEIRALELGISRSKKALTTRAFQQVPKELRRRTASHNAKRVPKRLRARAMKEMVEDNAPTVAARIRQRTKKSRLRLDTAKKLRALGAKRKVADSKKSDGQVTVRAVNSGKETDSNDVSQQTVKACAPKLKKANLAKPPVPKAKFRKRQVNKSWLPTHMFHAKRAHMSPPKEPMWRFAIAMTPTVKSYRPTHRAANANGALAWDTSYMATIGLQGRQRSIEGMLKALGVGSRESSERLWSSAGDRWRRGTRAWQGFVYEREAPHPLIAPVDIIWAVAPDTLYGGQQDEREKRNRKVLVRTHPSAFFQLWEEIRRLGKVAKPQVAIEDLRFEIGSIEMTGPGCTEALLGALWPVEATSDASSSPDSSVEQVWKKLPGLSSLTSVPSNALLVFDVQDPRLHYPPRAVLLPSGDNAQLALLQLLAAWPVDQTMLHSSIFDRKERSKASTSLPSQKAINRRKAVAAPGQYPAPLVRDPKVPILIYCAGKANGDRRKWTVLLPWKCVQPVWYSIMHYPLSSGGQPRFGGLQQQRQLAFEAGTPWFPGDFPGTKAGWDWEIAEREKRKQEWERKPKGKRVNWAAVELGGGHKGEIGLGWACDWTRLMLGPPDGPDMVSSLDSEARQASENAPDGQGPNTVVESSPRLRQFSVADVKAALKSTQSKITDLERCLATVRLTLLVRGVPQTCARIYRLPSTATHADLRKGWLRLHPGNHSTHKPHGGGPKGSLPRVSKNEPAWMVQRRLAQALLEPSRPGQSSYPGPPPESDLIGFVTTGNFNLSEGQGTGIGCLMLSRVVDGMRADERQGSLCIIRNAGNEVGRLAKFDFV